MNPQADIAAGPAGGLPAQAAGRATTSSTSDRRQLLLDALKDELFALETERLEGRISQEDYQQAKAGLDRALGRALGKK
jgi:hypothetical protein